MVNIAPEVRQAALELSAELGTEEAARRLGLSVDLVNRWRREITSRAAADHDPDALQFTLAKEASSQMRRWTNVAKQKEDIAVRLASEAHRLLDALHQPVVEKQVKTVSTGLGYSEAVVVEVHYDEPPIQSKAVLVKAVRDLVEKMNELTPDHNSADPLNGLGEDQRAARLADMVAILQERKEMRQREQQAYDERERQRHLHELEQKENARLDADAERHRRNRAAKKDTTWFGPPAAAPDVVDAEVVED